MTECWTRITVIGSPEILRALLREVYKSWPPGDDLFGPYPGQEAPDDREAAERLLACLAPDAESKPIVCSVMEPLIASTEMNCPSITIAVLLRNGHDERWCEAVSAAHPTLVLVITRCWDEWCEQGMAVWQRGRKVASSDWPPAEGDVWPDEPDPDEIRQQLEEQEAE